MLTIFAVSDSIGETAQQVAMAVSSQFEDQVEVKRVPYMKSLEDVEEFMKSLQDCGKCMVVSTIITVNVREFLTERCIENNINIVNVLGPIINVASNMLKFQPKYNPGAVRQLDEMYYKRIEAMEFAMQYDDSKDYRGLKNADVVLIGLSRTSKTPLCMYLANKGIKAINLPLIPEVGVPDELFNIERRKIIGLTIDPIRLIEIRKKRMDKFNKISSTIEYASDSRILEEMDFSDKVMKKLGCKAIDVTQRAIEDTAHIIMNEISSL
ncbi:kinase/pyrophosphorylase [Clostridium sp. 19966]|uniref:pyruvate, water dikinase regulatory protein n=1 Tax=Clostridium sp. 19966 TaxID=2768166 RepID=UPI0028DE2E89|nr:pyruvate, water dikinase regulatory protein [Clostridium sp. 19966]MDT8717438.1 kinase/pyrophosphorylase [Clostridium sp. 19966]